MKRVEPHYYSVLKQGYLRERQGGISPPVIAPGKKGPEK